MDDINIYSVYNKKSLVNYLVDFNNESRELAIIKVDNYYQFIFGEYEQHDDIYKIRSNKPDFNFYDHIYRESTKLNLGKYDNHKISLESYMNRYSSPRVGAYKLLNYMAKTIDADSVYFEANGCIGGDAQVLLAAFKKSYISELNPLSFDALKFNINLLGKSNMDLLGKSNMDLLDKINLFNCNCFEIINKYSDITHIYFDPPWNDGNIYLEYNNKKYNINEIINYLKKFKNIRHVYFKTPKSIAVPKTDEFILEYINYRRPNKISTYYITYIKL